MPESSTYPWCPRARWSPPLQKLQMPSFGLGPSAENSTTPMFVSWCAS